MDSSPARRYFLEPKETSQRHYEALRAIFVADDPLDRVAERFGYKTSALKSMASRFRSACRRGVAPPFFYPTAAAVPAGRPPVRADLAANRRRSPTPGN
jgi:hypothetical protein